MSADPQQLEPVRTTCPYCGVGCGVIATPDGRGGVSVKGDPAHPANFGRLCSKGSALGETLGLETRLLYPEIAGKRVSWDAALDHVALGLKRVRDRWGPESIAFYLSGQLITEDYYVANKLAKGFIGTPHVDTNSRLCMASTVAGQKRAFGADAVPQCYEDLELADLIVLVGSNAAWCHPILYQRIQAARAERGTRVVAIDPRRTATCEGVDLHLAIEPGADSQLWNGLLVWLADHGALDWDYIADHTDDFAAALAEARAQAPNIASVAIDTGLNGTDIENFYRLWTGTPRVLSCTSQGVNQSAQGTEKVNAITNCHLATGRIGLPGSGMLSFTGQPNAMGGREVGGMANTLAAHMGFSAADRAVVRRFWDAPNLVKGEGLKAVQMFDAVAAGSIKALWVMGTNPAVSLPRADDVRAALPRLELFVVSENVSQNDTIASSGVRLPAAAWGEKDGTVTNSERRISRQRAFSTPAGEAKPDWWIMSEVAVRLGWGSAFTFRSAADVFREYARLTAFDNSGTRVLNLGGLAHVSDAEYDDLAPIQWPVAEGSDAGTPRLFADGRFPTESGRARFLPIAFAAIASPPTTEWPFVLNTGRVRDQWHTMTRTGLSPRLSVHVPEPFVEIHPDDAVMLGLAQGAIARIETAYGSATVRTLVNDGARRGSIFAPIHWSAVNSSGGRIGALVHPITDPYSGQPEAKATPARLAKVAVTHYGFLLTRAAVDVGAIPYWARSAFSCGVMTALALSVAEADVEAWAGGILPGGERLTFHDAAHGVFRTAVLQGARLQAILYLSPSPVLPSAEWLKSCFKDEVQSADRRSLLAGRPIEGAVDEGPIVCVCYQVGRRRLEGEIAAGCCSVQKLGIATRAGTNCGSCVPELKRLLEEQPVQLAAAE